MLQGDNRNPYADRWLPYVFHRGIGQYQALVAFLNHRGDYILPANHLMQKVTAGFLFLALFLHSARTLDPLDESVVQPPEQPLSLNNAPLHHNIALVQKALQKKRSPCRSLLERAGHNEILAQNSRFPYLDSPREPM